MKGKEDNTFLKYNHRSMRYIIKNNKQSTNRNESDSKLELEH